MPGARVCHLQKRHTHTDVGVCAALMHCVYVSHLVLQDAVCVTSDSGSLRRRRRGPCGDGVRTKAEGQSRMRVSLCVPVSAMYSIRTDAYTCMCVRVCDVNMCVALGDAVLVPEMRGMPDPGSAGRRAARRRFQVCRSVKHNPPVLGGTAFGSKKPPPPSPFPLLLPLLSSHATHPPTTRPPTQPPTQRGTARAHDTRLDTHTHAHTDMPPCL